MNSSITHQVLLAKRPEGAPGPEVFEFTEAPAPRPGDNEFVVRVDYLSMDPALVGRMRAEQNYAESATPGEVMHAYGVGTVIASNWAQAPVGQQRLGRFDMQEYALCNASSFGFPINTERVPASWYLSVLGATGATAWLSFYDICMPKKGETLVISSAGSSVGTVVAQLARAEGCRVVGIVSTEEKAARVSEEWSYDAVLAYRGKSIDVLAAALRQACPDGIDMYYDNTSGDISEALLDLYNVGARIAVVGRAALSHLPDTRQDVGRRDNNVILSRRIRKQGFVLTDHHDRMPEAMLSLGGLVHEGKLSVKVDVMQGIEQVPAAFLRMLRGENNGKQLVRLTSE